MNRKVPSYANSVVAFIIGLAIILLASLLNRTGLDYVRASADEKTSGCYHV